jgi:hypothetical protein
MRRLAALTLLLALPTAPAIAQSLGEVAARTNKERKGTSTKVYTNDDLRDARTAEERAATAAAPAAAEPPAPPPTMDPAARWQRDAKARRAAIARAEATVAAVQARIDALTLDRDPSNVLDPNRMQNRDAERTKALQELDAAKEALAKARQDLEDLEEEARKASVPPGWLREP